MASSSIQSYRDLQVWQEGMNLAEACYRVTRGFPKEEMYGISSQIRRAAASLLANIAEGYGREYRTEYIHFLRIAQGSLKELETHLILVARVEITTAQTVRPILNQCESVGRLLRALIRSLQNKQ